MTVEDLKLVFAHIPNRITSNLFYQEILKQLLEVFSSFIRQDAEVELSLNETLYDEDLDDIDDLYILDEEDPLLIEFKCHTNSFHVEFNVVVSGMVDMIDLSISKEKEHFVCDNLSLNILREETQVNKDHFVWEGNNLLDASMDMKIYDSSYQEIKKEEALRKVNERFALYFGIPLKISQTCREHFQMFQNFLNESRIQNVQNLNNQAGMYKFHSPFDYQYIDEFFSMAQFCADDEAQTFDKSPIQFDQQQWKKFLEFFTTNFGNVGEFILSDSFVDNALIYLMDKNIKHLDTKGIVLKKVNGEYYVYYFECFKDKLNKEEKKISKEEAIYLVKKDPNNSFISGINEFLGLERER